MDGQWVINYNCRRCLKESTQMRCCEIVRQIELPESLTCEECQYVQAYTSTSNRTDQFAFECPKCERSSSVKKGLINFAHNGEEHVMQVPETLTCELCGTVSPVPE